jgi:hypothetical protein
MPFGVPELIGHRWVADRIGGVATDPLRQSGGCLSFTAPDLRQPGRSAASLPEGRRHRLMPGITRSGDPVPRGPKIPRATTTSTTKHTISAPPQQPEPDIAYMSELGASAKNAAAKRSLRGQIHP